MNNLIIQARQMPGVVTFDNFEEVRSDLQRYISESFSHVNYDVAGIDAAIADRDELKKMRDVITKKQKQLKEAYTAPYVTVGEMLDELVSMIDVPYKKAKAFVDTEAKTVKQRQIMDFAQAQAQIKGKVGQKVIESPAFFNARWLNKTFSMKNVQDEIKATL